MRSQMSQKNLALLTGSTYYRGRLKFHDFRAIMTNTPYRAFAYLEQLFSLINNRNVDVVVNFLSQVIFVFLLFLGMEMYVNEVESKEKQKLPEIKN